jgi:death on curing protein
VIRYIELIEVLTAHEALIERSGGRSGIREIERIHAAVESPRQTFGGEDLYPTLADKAAILGYLLTVGHGFLDGNKRIGYHMMELFLLLNGYQLEATQDDIVHVMNAVAGELGQRMDREAFTAWVTEHMIPF